MTTKTIELPPTEKTRSRPRGRGRLAGAVVLAAVGALLALIGAGAIGLQLIGGGEDGYLTRSADLETGSYALATGTIDLDPVPDIPDGMLGTVRIRMTPEGDRPLFVGIARAAQVERYLSGVRHAQISDIDDDGEATYRLLSGDAKPAAPMRQRIWQAESRGSGEQSITWKPEAGEWKVVTMNADANPGVAVHAEAAARLGWLLWTGLGFLLAGFALIAVAILVGRLRSAGRAQP